MAPANAMVALIFDEKTYLSFTAFAAWSAKSFELESMMSVFPVTEMGMPGAGLPRPQAPTGEARLWEAAQALEAGFVSEMLKAAGVGAPRQTFGGGIGEEQFASFLRDAQAREMVQAGGIGLAESLFEAMRARQDG